MTVDPAELQELDQEARAFGYRVDYEKQWYLVWRVDQGRDSAWVTGTCNNAAEVRDMINTAKTLPRWCLRLRNNPRVTVSPPVSGVVTVTDNHALEHPGLKLPAEYEDAEHVCVHTDGQPAIGDWQLMPPGGIP